MTSLLTLIGSLVQKAHAAGSPFQGYCDSLGTYCGDGQSFIIHLALRAGHLVFQLVGGVAVIAALWGSIKMIATGADEQGKEEGKKILILAITGITLAFAATSIIKFVCNFFANATGNVGFCSAL